ncbi:signal-regulatory protein beta-1-like [Larus michahellis]|uniref:signal-regulatory protein beta-1-like n=1 Tax=Larus michahellis TaxID=119627 RepID=UPI003D9AD7C5
MWPPSAAVPLLLVLCSPAQPKNMLAGQRQRRAAAPPGFIPKGIVIQGPRASRHKGLRGARGRRAALPAPVRLQGGSGEALGELCTTGPSETPARAPILLARAGGPPDAPGCRAEGWPHVRERAGSGPRSLAARCWWPWPWHTSVGRAGVTSVVRTSPVTRDGVNTLGTSWVCARGPWRNLVCGEPLPSPLPGQSPAPSRAEQSPAEPSCGEQDVGMTMARVTRGLPLACLMLLLLRRAPGAGAQVSRDFKLQQPQDKVSVAAGETLTLTCTTSGNAPAGPVKWLKGWGSGNQTIYDQTNPLTYGVRAVNGTNTDFTIRIRDVQPEDAGTYYCVKFRKSVSGDEVYQHGKGTEVSVRAKPTPPVVSGPEDRAGPGQSVAFTCTAGGFFPEDIRVKWLKDGVPISAQQPTITPERMKSSYNMVSTVMMPLGVNDVRSQVVCEVRHPTLTAPLRETYQLRQALRVSPSIQVDADLPSPVGVNKTVKFTCHVKGFYPRDVAITWLENGMEMNMEYVSQPVETPQGLFKLTRLVEVKAMEEKNGSVFTCRVVHDAQEPVDRTATLWITATSKSETTDSSQTVNGWNLLSSPGLWLGILLEKGLLGGLLLFLFKRVMA